MFGIRIPYPKLRELKEALTSLFSKPYTSNFPYKEHKPYERFRGRPYFYEEDCTGCAACAQVCPTGAIEFADFAKDGVFKRALTIRWDICIFCGLCQANCLTGKGIMLSREFDLATTENREALRQTIEKELVLCECCGEPVAPYDQFVWVAAKLGPLCFSNSSLLLFYLKALNLSLQQSVSPSCEVELLRQDRIKIICPSCRRQAVLKS